MIRKNNFDEILVTRLLILETKTHYVQGYVRTEELVQYNNFKKSYDTYYHDVDYPGYVDSLIIKRSSIGVWTVRNEGKLIWSATSKSPESNTSGPTQNDIDGLVINELLSNAIINPKSRAILIL
jgi:hypothetical protein